MSCSFVVFEVRMSEKVLYHEPTNITTHKYKVLHELNYIAKTFTLSNCNKTLQIM